MQNGGVSGDKRSGIRTVQKSELEGGGTGKGLRGARRERVAWGGRGTIIGKGNHVLLQPALKRKDLVLSGELAGEQAGSQGKDL